MQNKTNQITRDTIALGKSTLRYIPLLITEADCGGFGVGKFGARVQITAEPLALTISILYIVAMRTKPEMRRINTGWVIAARTIVEHPKAIWDRAKMKLPCNTGCFNKLPHVRMAYDHASISLPVPVGCPFPAGIGIGRDGDFRPKTFGERKGRTAYEMSRINMALKILTGAALFGPGGQRKPAAAGTEDSIYGKIELHREPPFSVSCSRLFPQRESYLYYTIAECPDRVVR